MALRTRLSSGGFLHSVLTLVGGTAFAQAVMVLALPLLTRLYTPADFSVLAVYASILAIFSVIACLRFEVAVPIPKSDQDAASLLVLALLFSFFAGLFVALLVFLLPAQIITVTGQPGLKPYLWLIPLGVWLTSSYAAFQFWSTRKRKFTRIARTRALQAAGAISVQSGMGWLGIAPFGLLLGHMVSSGAGLFGLGRDAWREDRAALCAVRFSSMRRMFGEYIQFPKYSAPEALANNAGIQLPVIVIAAFAVGPEAGYLMLAMRVMAAPMALVGGAVSQVYLSRAPEEHRSGTLSGFTAEMLTGLVNTGVGPLLFAGIVAPNAFALLFGEEWKRAGELVMWMTPWFIFQFLSSPVSMVMHVTGQQKQMLFVTVSGLLIRGAAMLLAIFTFRGLFSELYAIAGAVFYLGCFVAFYRVAGLSIAQCLVASRRGLVAVIAWVVAAAVINATLEAME